MADEKRDSRVAGGRTQQLGTSRTRLIVGAGVVAALLIAAGALAAVLAARGNEDAAPPAAAEPGLPRVADYHALLVHPERSRELLLGTHDGIYRSGDGGRRWAPAGLQGRDAMNIQPAGKRTLWVSGHDVLAKSTDGGATWADLAPDGLPKLDVHAFAAHPRKPNELYAAIAGEGTYRSTDGGTSFVLLSSSVGLTTTSFAVAPNGRLLAGDPRHGLLESSDGALTWRQGLAPPIVGVAVSRTDGRRVLATGGSGVSLSTDGGRSWRTVLPLVDGAGPVAWSHRGSSTAYVVGFDRVLYRSDDHGETWAPVA